MASKYGPWEVQDTLSQGGQGQIFLVTHEDDSEGKTYALKRFLNPDRLERYEDEVRAAIELDHPNIVVHIDHDIEGDKPYLVLQHYEGGTLGELDLTDWSTVERLHLFSTICDAVGHAHTQGIVHRDLKPGNIFLRDDGRMPIVGDFGICFIDERGERVTLTDEQVGPRKFIPPELEDGRAQDVTARSDVYSLGKLLYWLFEGKVFAREKHRHKRWSLTGPQKDLSDVEKYERGFINRILDAAIAESPADRFPNANLLGARIDRDTWRIEKQMNVTDLRETQLCSFCGNGQYKPVLNSSKRDVETEDFGLGEEVRGEILVLWCNNCGHTQHFQLDILPGSKWEGMDDISWKKIARLMD